MSARRNVNKYLGLPSGASSVEHLGKGVVPIILEVSPGKATLKFDFLNDRPQMQRVFFEYFVLIGEAVAPISKLAGLQAIKQFNYFLDEYEKKNGIQYRTTDDIDHGILLNFKVWLQTRPRFSKGSNKPRSREECDESEKPSARTAAGLYNSFVSLLNRLKQYRPEWFPLISGALPRARMSPVSSYHVEDVLSIRDLKKIMTVVSAEIERVRQRYAEIKKLLRETEDLPILPLAEPRPAGYWRSKANAVHSVVREQGPMGRVKNKLKQGLDRQGTNLTKVLGAYVPITEAALLPFALQLSIQTGLNVTSLVGLERDCIQDFVLPQYKKLLYDKPRSGSRRSKSQLIPASEVGATNKNSPVELIRFLKEWTEPLVANAPDHVKDYLFIYRPRAGIRFEPAQRVKAVSKYDAFARLRSALKDHPELPKFSLRDLRPAVATYLYLTTHDVSRVQRFLGHRSFRTTDLYIRGRILAAEHDSDMARGIQKMISRLLPQPAAVKTIEQGRALPVLATVVESMPFADMKVGSNELGLRKSDIEAMTQSGVMTLVARCRRPDKPPAFLKVPAGQLCTKIFKCLNCPNAIVLEEDLPTLLLRTKGIWAERERFSPEAWQILYGEAWLTLNQAFRLFSKEARERAENYLQLTSPSANEV